MNLQIPITQMKEVLGFLSPFFRLSVPLSLFFPFFPSFFFLPSLSFFFCCRSISPNLLLRKTFKSIEKLKESYSENHFPSRFTKS